MNLAAFALGLALIHSGLAQDNQCDNEGPVIACYYASWSYYRLDDGHYNISHIDPTLCTHLVYTFAGLDLDGKIGPLDPNYDVTKGGYQYFNSLKQINPCLKTLLAIGGWNEGSRKYSVMVSDADSRKAFVDSVLRFITAYNFDGLDIDWEYPADRGGIASDKDNFSLLIEELRERFEKWGLTLTIAAPISEAVVAKAFDVAAVDRYIDRVFLMAYDYTSTDSKTTGLIAPLSEIRKTVDFWLRNGLRKSKLVLGMPSYARTLILEDPEDHEIGAPTEGPGEPGPYTKEAGFLSYYELQFKLSSGLYEVETVDNGGTYAYCDTEWMSFDTIEDYVAKTNYALAEGLGGVMLWSIDTDDFHGYFGPVNTILSTLYNITREHTENANSHNVRYINMS